MPEFYEMVEDCFVWTEEIPTMGCANGRIYCNREWWRSLSVLDKIKYIEHELKHAAFQRKT